MVRSWPPTRFRGGDTECVDTRSLRVAASGIPRKRSPPRPRTCDHVVVNSTRATETEAGYDAAAADYVDRTSTRSREAKAFLSRFVDLLSPNSLVLDVGSGSGTDARRFSEAGHHGFALDRSTKLLALSAGDLRLRADFCALPLVDSCADALWSHASLLHVESDALGATFDEWQRVVRPGGLVAFVTSLGGDSGWELAPASQRRVPEMVSGARRWFVHHESAELQKAMLQRGWVLMESSVRRSHRDWILAMARTPG